jgi:hypothetical protein
VRFAVVFAAAFLAACSQSGSAGFVAQTSAGSLAVARGGSVQLHGYPAEVSFDVAGKAGQLQIPAQLGVPPNDSVRATTGTKPQAGMPPVPLVPAATIQLVYAAVYFTHSTKTSHGLGMLYELPASVNPKSGSFYLASYDAKKKSWNTSYAKPLRTTSRDVSISPTGGAVTYQANAANGIALYQIATKP